MRTPNSPFIFDLLCRSTKQCAFLLAILRPAPTTEDDFFFVGARVAFPAPFFEELRKDSLAFSGCPLGFIGMIFRDLDGGGGKAKASAGGACAIEDLLRILTTSLAGDWGDIR